jgi:hypothetical protein
MIPWDAVFALHKVLLAIALVTLGYGFVLRRLAEIVQPYRLRLAELGEKYLEMPLKAEERKQIIFYLENAFNPWIIVMAAVGVPLALLIILFRRSGRDTEYSKNHDDIALMFTISVIAANPIFAFIAALELFVAAIFAILLHKHLNFLKKAVHMFFQFKAVGWHRSEISTRNA